MNNTFNKKKLAAGTAAFSVLATGGFVAAGAQNDANAAGTRWSEVNAGPNNSGSSSHSSGYDIDNLLSGSQTTSVVGWENPQNKSIWSWCIAAGHRASGQADETGKIPADSPESKLAAYAMSMYSDKNQDRVTNAAVALIVHQNLDQGASGLDDRYGSSSAENTRKAFKDAEGDAPQAVKDRANQIRKEFRNFKAPTETQAKVDITEGDIQGIFNLSVDVPGNIPTTVTLSNGAKFTDGSTSKKFTSDQKVEVVFAVNNPYSKDVIKFDATATPDKKTVRVPASQINTFQTAGKTESGFPFQTMAWATPSTVNITGGSDSAVIQPFNVEDIALATQAKDSADGDKYISPKGGTLTDTVAYKNVASPGYEHEMKATLMNKETGEPVLDENGEPIVVSKKFTPKERNGSIDIQVPVPGIAAGNTFVVFEQLYFNGELIREHADINDEGQTVYVPEAGTKARDAADKDQYLLQKGGKIVDTVSYKGLRPGTEYTVDGVLMDKETGKPFVDAEGKEIRGTAKFTPKTENGQVEVTFDVPPTAAGKTLVAFEKVSDPQVGIVATHEDINDEEQTVYVPDIGTTAKDKLDEDNYITQEGGQVVDTVKYKNLKPGTEYTIHGTLMDKETGKPLVDTNGKAVESTAKLTPEERNGTVDVIFKLPPEAAGKTLVAFEKAIEGETEIAIHEDINDVGQTVYVADIGTQASDLADGDKSLADRDGTVVDEVEYTNLEPGTTYTFEGKLLDKIATEEAGENVFLKDEKGNDIVVKKEYTPETPNGTVKLEFPLPVHAKGKTLVAFERVSDDLGLVAKHEDGDDEEQTVYVRNIHTLAKDKLDGDKNLTQKGSTIVDTVSYKNFVPGATYTMKGVLVDREATLEALKKDPEADIVYIEDKTGKPVQSEMTFTVPKDAEWEKEYTVDLEFKVPDSAVGKDIVVFEKAFDDKENPVAEHEDPSDDAQTVYVADMGTLAYDKEDGNSDIYQGGKLVDRIEYENLAPGKKYTVKGSIYNKNAGELTKITAEKTFTADESGDGVVELEFDIPKDQAYGRYVVFEELYDENDVLTAEHKDPKDVNQSFEIVPKPEKPETPDQHKDNPPAPEKPAPQPPVNSPATVKTGGQVIESDGVNAGLAGLLAAAALATGGAVVLRRKFSL